MEEFEEELRLLEERLKPLAGRAVDLADPSLRKKLRAMSPLDEAGLRSRAEKLLERLVAAYGAASDAERERLRELFRRHPSFAWAAALPRKPLDAERFRLHLLHFSLADQGDDSRDAIVWLDALRARAKAARIEPGPALKEAAALSSDRDRFGMGSTRALLLRAR